MYASDPVRKTFSIEHPEQDAGPWAAWRRLVPYGYQAAKAVYDDLQKMDLDGHGDSWASPYVKAMEKHFEWNRCDFFYLPAKLRGPYVQLSSVFAKHKVYFSLAIPTMFS